MIAARLLALGSLVLLLGAAEPSVSDFVADARSIERRVNEDYAYLDRFPGQLMPMTAKLRAEADAVTDRRSLARYAERAMTVLADHHSIAGSSFKDSWALVPSYADLWVERRGSQFTISAVRDGSPAAKAEVRPGDVLHAVDGQSTATAIAAFWADLGTEGGGERDNYAARVLAAGKRDRPRRLTIGQPLERPRELILPNLYSDWRPQLPPLTVDATSDVTRIRFNDSLGDTATIAAFDAAMTRVGKGRRLLIDLTDTPSGGNTTVARAVLGWFVTRPTAYQVHRLPGEERRTGIARQWVEQVLPRPGKSWRGPVTVRVGRWTGSMGEGLAIGFDAMGARVEGDRMAGLLGAIYDIKLEQSGLMVKFPVERLSAIDGTPREHFVPRPARH